jgi:hypothetical protein
LALDKERDESATRTGGAARRDKAPKEEAPAAV